MKKVEFIIVCGLIVVLVLESTHGDGIPHLPEQNHELVIFQDSAGPTTSASFS